LNPSRLIAWASNIVTLIAFLYPFKQKVELIENSGLAEVHAGLYFFLFMVFYRAQYPKEIIFVLLTIQGIAIEYIQPLVGRGFSVLDMVGNCSGLAIAYALSVFLSKRSTGPARKTSEKS
jgi:VanZ family protein